VPSTVVPTMFQEPPSIHAADAVVAPVPSLRRPPVAPCSHQEVNCREQLDRSFRGTPKMNNTSEPCGGAPEVGGEFDNCREATEDSMESGIERVSVMGNSRADSACGSCASASEQTFDPESDCMDVQSVLKNLLDGQAWLAGVQGALQDMQLQVAAHVEEQLDKMMLRVEEQLRANRLSSKLEIAAEVRRQLANPQAHVGQHACSMSPAMSPRGRVHDATFVSASRSLSSCGSSVSLLSSCVAAPLSPGRELQVSGRASDYAPLHEEALQPVKRSLEWQGDGPTWPTARSNHCQDSATDAATMKLPNVFAGMPSVAVGSEIDKSMGNSQLPEQLGAGEPRIWSQQLTRSSRSLSATQLNVPTPGFGGQEFDGLSVRDYTRSCSPPDALSPCRSPRSPCLSPRQAATLENSCAKLNAALRVPQLALHQVSRAPDAQLQDILAWRRLKSEGQTERSLNYMGED